MEAPSLGERSTRKRRLVVAAPGLGDAARTRAVSDAGVAASAECKLRQLLQDGKKIIVFSGSGISSAAGLSTFSGSLYAKAARKFKLKDGSKTFCYSFLQSNPKECFSFFRDLYRTVAKATPTRTHYAFKAMEDSEQMVRHYTLNFDGLATAGGMSVWKAESQESSKSSASLGTTVELHGNIHELVCRQCGAVSKMTTTTKPIPKCKHDHCQGDLRFRVLLYDDQESHLISSANPLADLLPHDLEQCHAVVWVGISFQQSASCQHFGLVLAAALRANDESDQQIPMFIIDPNPTDCLENLMDGLQQQIGSDGGVFVIESTSDDFFGEFRK